MRGGGIFSHNYLNPILTHLNPYFTVLGGGEGSAWKCIAVKSVIPSSSLLRMILNNKYKQFSVLAVVIPNFPFLLGNLILGIRFLNLLLFRLVRICPCTAILHSTEHL